MYTKGQTVLSTARSATALSGEGGLGKAQFLMEKKISKKGTTAKKKKPRGLLEKKGTHTWDRKKAPGRTLSKGDHWAASLKRKT